ncbi:MAG TPA: HlyD family efflux transporter periplasmic adaptor subunit [Bacillota bacterium]|nr:HlyD family efflux transporter periplasmic adaptor subunit [Bacillota bacterium]
MVEEPRERKAAEDTEDARGGFLRRFGLWVLIALALIFLTVAYSMMYDSLIGRITPTIAVREGTLERFVPCKAVIIRDEAVVRSPAAGVLNVVAPEGSRVAKGETVVRIGGQPEPQQGESTAAGDGGLLIAQLELEKAEAAEYDARAYLQSKQEELIIYEKRGDQKGAERIRSQIADAQDALSAATAKKLDAKAAYQEKLAASKVAQAGGGAYSDPGGLKVRATRPAAVSYSWDGLESLFSPANPGLLEVPYGAVSEAQQAVRKQGDEIAEGDPAFREISSISTDFLLYMRDVDPEIVKVGSNHRVRFSRLSSEKVSAKVKKYRQDGSGGITVYLTMDRYVSSMAGMRTTDAEFLLESYSGLIVPARAISTAGGRSSLQVLRRDRFIAVDVEVLGIVGADAAVRSDALKPGDKVKYDG